MGVPSFVRFLPAWAERLWLGRAVRGAIPGGLRLPEEVYSAFLQAPWDVCPDFEGPERLWRGRGGDHPRYGRFCYALALATRPGLIVEVGSYAGGTAVGWARALAENGNGRLICVDNDSYSRGAYPGMTRRNLERTELDLSRVTFLNGDSREVLPGLTQKERGAADIYLVDGDHTYEGALADLSAAPELLSPGGLLLVHDVDPERAMPEATPEHLHPVLEAFRESVDGWGWNWTILTFVRKHLGVARAE